MEEEKEINEDLNYTINVEDFIDSTKEEAIDNLKNLWERNKAKLLLLDNTEKDRLRLLKENQEFKKKLGEFAIVKKLMDSAGIYGYTDFLKEE